MNTDYRFEIDQLKRRQLDLHEKLSDMRELSEEVTALAEQISRLEARLDSGLVSEESSSVVALPAHAAIEEPPEVALPPIISDAARVLEPPAFEVTHDVPPVDHDERSGEVFSMGAEDRAPFHEQLAQRKQPANQEPVSQNWNAANETAETGERSSFEMRLGTYWLVRVGIIMLLTAMVFFGRYAYQNYIGLLGPGGKIGLLYLASGLLLGVGAWLQRKKDDTSLRRYGEVLLAGGLAAVYFTTYAAHYIPPMRIIQSSVLAGTLLLSWAGVMVWVADRRKSEVLALFAIGLAYYSSAVTKIEWFTLFSNLVLTIAVIFFLIRNRWSALSVVGFLATYAGYAYWRFYSNEGWELQTDLPAAMLQKAMAFLAAYWIAFTAAAFLSRDQRLTGSKRVTFATANNAAFFALVLLTMAHLHRGGFWKLALGFGLVLIAAAAMARRFLSDEPLFESAYLTQGLLLVTIGFIAAFTGGNLALVLSAQSVLLLFLGQRLNNSILRAGSFAVGGLAAVWGINAMNQTPPAGILLGVSLGAFMLGNARQVKLRARNSEAVTFSLSAAYFVALALLHWLATTWQHTIPEHRAAVLALEAALFSASVYLVALPEVAVLGQVFLVLGQVIWMAQAASGPGSQSAWSALAVIVISLGLSHWWPRQKRIVVDPQATVVPQSLYALAIVGVLFFWLKPLVSAEIWLGLTSVVAVGLTIYSAATKAWPLAAAGQLFFVVSGVEFVRQLWEGKPEWFWPLVPIGALGLLAWLGRTWLERRVSSGRDKVGAVRQIGVLYRWTALVMMLVWTTEYIPARERCWFLTLLGAVFFVWSGWDETYERTLFSAILTGAGLWWLWVSDRSEAAYLPNFWSIAVWLGQQQLARRMETRFALKQEWHHAIILVGGITLWWLTSRWLVLQSAGFYLTVCWTALALALFITGLVLRERMYRWLGLGILACALGRVAVIDVWKLEQVYRIFSFMALGIVLLLLGFIYNKYQEKIREWL